MGGPPQGPWSFPGVPWCPRVLEKISKIPKNYIKNIHAKKYPKLYSQHPFWGTWMPWGGPGGSKSSEGLRRGFFAPNRKVQKPNIVCIYPINNSPVVKIENFEISILSPPLSTLLKDFKSQYSSYGLRDVFRNKNGIKWEKFPSMGIFSTKSRFFLKMSQSGKK